MQNSRIIFLAIILLGFFGLAHSASAKTFYLDGNLSSDCTSGNYSIANGTCTGSDGDAYNTLADVITALAGGDTLYIRAGSYTRTTNDWTTGALHINNSKNGTAGNHTVISAYPGEERQAIIGTDPAKLQYNPDPTTNQPVSCGGHAGEGNGRCYYPNPAIYIGGGASPNNAKYIDVKNLKTYGMVLLQNASLITIEGNDIGGCGPFFTWGHALFFHAQCGAEGHNYVRNNKIHRGCLGENQASTHSAAVASYQSNNHIIENNEIYDGYVNTLEINDCENAPSGTIEIRNNFIKDSTIFANVAGYTGIAQYGAACGAINVHNNIFYHVGINAFGDTGGGIYYYNNTFIDSATSQDGHIHTLGSYIDSRYRFYNNLSYFTAANPYHMNSGVTISDFSHFSLDYNVYYNTASTPHWRNGNHTDSTLGAWSSYLQAGGSTGYEGNSLSANPNFLNPTGSNPEDFKRSSYTENFTGSSYGIHAGAYETGNETIGIDWTTPADVTPPAAPSGLSVS